MTINLNTQSFAESRGIFQLVHSGQLTQIVNAFNPKDAEVTQQDIDRYLSEEDAAGRVRLDLACFLNFKNVALYLMVKSGRPDEYIERDLHEDKEGRNCYHTLCYKGNYDTMATTLNYERVCLKKTIFDKLQEQKQRFKFKNLDIKHGALVSTVYHDAETLRRHIDFNAVAISLFETYTSRIVDRYR